MKNKGRKHKHGLTGILDCKSMIAHITRPIGSMSSGVSKVRGRSNKFNKQKWSKRVRGYFKSQVKEL
jgi:hypothetical protein